MTVKFGKDYFNYIKSRNLDYSVKGGWQKEYAEYIQKVLDVKGPILDFGCNVGAIGSAMVDLGMDAYGLDIDQWYVDACMFPNFKSKMKSYDGVIFPYENDFFDVVHASQTMEHIPGILLPQVLKEINRILKPNGLLYFASPLEHETYTGDPTCKEDETHVSCLSEKQWNVLLKKAKFKIRTQEFASKWKDEKMFQTYNWPQYIGQKS